MNESDTSQRLDFANGCHAWSRAIHWITVVLMLGLLITGLFGNIDPHGSGNRAFWWHSSLGIGVYLLAVSRVLLWIVSRPASSNADKGKPRWDSTLRIAFYALLVALPVSGWWLASEDGMSTRVLGVPMLPQWYHQESTSPSMAAQSEASRDYPSRKGPLISNLARLHASLNAALALVIALHIILTVRNFRARNGGKPPQEGR
jgi:cytochrome b561